MSSDETAKLSALTEASLDESVASFLLLTSDLDESSFCGSFNDLEGNDDDFFNDLLEWQYLPHADAGFCPGPNFFDPPHGGPPNVVIRPPTIFPNLDEMPGLDNWDAVVLKAGKGRNKDKQITDATTVWYMVRSMKGEDTTSSLRLQDFLDAYFAMRKLRHPYGERQVRFYVSRDKAMKNQNWVSDWNNVRKDDNNVAYVLVNEDCVWQDIRKTKSKNDKKGKKRYSDGGRGPPPRNPSSGGSGSPPHGGDGGDGGARRGSNGGGGTSPSSGFGSCNNNNTSRGGGGGGGGSTQSGSNNGSCSDWNHHHQQHPSEEEAVYSGDSDSECSEEEYFGWSESDSELDEDEDSAAQSDLTEATCATVSSTVKSGGSCTLDDPEDPNSVISVKSAGKADGLAAPHVLEVMEATIAVPILPSPSAAISKNPEGIYHVLRDPKVATTSSEEQININESASKNRCIRKVDPIAPPLPLTDDNNNTAEEEQDHSRHGWPKQSSGDLRIGYPISRRRLRH